VGAGVPPAQCGRDGRTHNGHSHNGRTHKGALSGSRSSAATRD